MPKKSLSNPEFVDCCSMSARTSRWREKTRATNKLRFNMKVLLNPKFKKYIMIGIEDSLDKEDPKTKRVENMFTRVLEKNDEGIKKFPNILEGKHFVKGIVLIEG